MTTGRWSVGECLRMSAVRWPQEVALKDARRERTYRELDERANRVANALTGLGLGKGDVCAFLFHNGMEIIEVFMGLARSGVVGVPINFRNTAREIEYLMRHSGARALLLGAEFLERVEPLVGECIDRDACVVLGAQTGGYQSYEEWLRRASARAPSAAVGEDDVWYIGYTSGTTDFPKGVPTRHRAILENATQWMVDYGRYDEADRFLLIMPLFHANGIMCSFLALAVGATLYLHRSGAFDAEEILRVVDREKITITSVVPTMLSLILDLPRPVLERYDRETIQTLLVASAPLWTNVKEGTLACFPRTRLYEAYGSTEHQIVTVLKPQYQWSKIRSIGKPILYKDVVLLDPDGNEVAPGQPGTLYARGWGIPLQEYFKDPGATARAFRGEWSTVEDIATRDEEGFYYLVDRKKDMIISGGENVSPSEVENEISKHPAVREVAVIGRPDDKWGEAVTAVVVLREGMAAGDEEIRAFCEGRMARFKMPRFVDFVPELPKNPTGKILRKEVRKPYWADLSVKI